MAARPCPSIRACGIASIRACGIASILAALGVAWPAAALAQSNHRLAPVGGRTTLVGGTGLAFGRDSASAFLNPATVVRVDPGRLAFSVNFYALSLTVAPDWYHPGSVDRATFGAVPRDRVSITNAEFDPLPGSLCGFFRIGDIPFMAREASADLRERQARLGICLATVQSSSFLFNAEDYAQASATGRTRQAGSIRQTFGRFAIGPSYAMYIDDHLAIGASVHLSRASFRNTVGNTATTYGPGPSPINSGFYKTSRGDSFDLSVSAGATYRIRNQTLALTVELPSLHLFGNGGINLYTHSNGGPVATANTTAAGDFRFNTPLRVGLGTGYEASWGSAELNVGFYAPQAKAYQASMQGRSLESGAGQTVDRAIDVQLGARSRGAVNLGLGGEVFLTPKISLLGGINTDISSVPKGTLGTDPLDFHSGDTSRVAVSFGYGSHGEGGDLLIGSELSYGWGERLAVNAYQLPPRLDPTPTRTFSALFVLAGSTSIRAITRAVTDATKAIIAPTKGTPDEPRTRETETMKTDRQADPKLKKPILVPMEPPPEPADPATSPMDPNDRPPGE
jgi:hypothetical protein